MIVQIENTLFVTPDAGCDICDGTGAVWVDREANAAEECPCITRQLDDHEPAFANYEVIDSKHKLYDALKLLDAAHEKIEHSEKKNERN